MFKRLGLPSFGGRTPRGSQVHSPRGSCISENGVLPQEQTATSPTASEDLDPKAVTRIGSVRSVRSNETTTSIKSARSNVGRQKSLKESVSSVVGFVKNSVARRRTVAVTSSTTSKRASTSGIVSSLVKDPLQSSLEGALKSDGPNESVHWATKILTDTEIREKLKESSKNLVAGFIDQMAGINAEVADLDFKTRNQLTVWLEEEMVSGLHKIGMRVFEACQNLRDTHARMQERVKECEEKMSAMNMQYLKEVTQKRDQGRPPVSFLVEQACGGPLDGSTGAYDFYDPLLYMPKTTKEHVFAIVEEKLKQVFCANPNLKDMCDGHQLIKQMNAKIDARLSESAEKIKDLEDKNSNLQGRLKAAEASRANQKLNNFKLQEKNHLNESEMMKVRGDNLKQKRRVSELLVSGPSLTGDDGATCAEEVTYGPPRPEAPAKPSRRSFRESIVWQHVRELTLRVKVQTEELLAQYTKVEDVKRKLEQVQETLEVTQSRNQALELAGHAFLGEGEMSKLDDSASKVFNKSEAQPQAQPQAKEGKRRSVVSEAKSTARKPAGGKRLSLARKNTASLEGGAANPPAAMTESNSGQESQGTTPAESKSGDAAPAEDKSGDKVTISAAELQQVVLNNKVLTESLQKLKREGEELAARLSAAMQQSGKEGERYSFLHSDSGSVFKRLLQAVEKAGGQDVMEVLARVDGDGGGRPPGMELPTASDWSFPADQLGQEKVLQMTGSSGAPGSYESGRPSIVVQSCQSQDAPESIGLSTFEARPRPSVIPEGCESARASIILQNFNPDAANVHEGTAQLEEPHLCGFPESEARSQKPSTSESEFEERAPAGFEMQVCGCGNVLMPDALFCRKCGSKRGEGVTVPVAEVATQVCPCGNVLLPDAVFCRKCGVKRPSLERKPPEAPAQAEKMAPPPSDPPPSHPPPDNPPPDNPPLDNPPPSNPSPSSPPSSPKAAASKRNSVRPQVRRGGSFLGQSGAGAVMGADMAPAAAFGSASPRVAKSAAPAAKNVAPASTTLLELDSDVGSRTQASLVPKMPTNAPKPRAVNKGAPEAIQPEPPPDPSATATVGSGKWRTLQKQNTSDLGSSLRSSPKAKSAPFSSK